MQITDLLNLFPPIFVRLFRSFGRNTLWSVRNTISVKDLNKSKKNPVHCTQDKSSNHIQLGNVVIDLKAGHCFNAEYAIIRETSNWPSEDLTKGTIPRPIATPRVHHFDTFVLAMPSNGFYHWLIEDLPGVVKMLAEEGISKVLVYKNAPKYVFDFLKSFEIEFFEFPRFSKFTQVSIPIRNQDVGEPKDSDMLLLRKFFLPKIHIEPVKHNVYISRLKSKRSPVFERNLQSQLSAKGWRIVYLEEINLLDQFSIFQNASSIVGIHGAGLSGMVFANPGTPIFELYPIERDIKCFENLARATGLSITRIPFANGSNEVPPELISRLNLL